MATLAVAAAVPAGVAIATVTASGGGDVFPNDGKTVLFVNNGSGVSVTVTVTPQNTLSGLALAAVAVVVPAGAARYAGPFPPAYFNNGNGQAVVTYSAVTTVTVGALSVLA